MIVFPSAIRRKLTPYIPLLAYVVFACFVALATFQTFHKIENLIEFEKIDDLGSIADLKVGQITSWREGHLKQAAAFSNSGFLAPEFEGWLQEGGHSGEREHGFLRELSGLQLTHGYATAALLDRQGRARITTGNADMLDGADVRLALEAMNSRKPLFSDFHRRENGSPAVTISLAAPLIESNKKNGLVVGAVLLQIDPRDFLYPLIQSWPGPSPSAETLLARRDGDEVVFLNELRHRKGAPLSLHIPINRTFLPTAMGIRGETGTKGGVDYRGVPVVAAMRQVPGTAWFMVAKVDKDEIFAPIYQLKRMGASLGLAFAVLGGFFFFVWLQAVQARKKQLKAQRDAALERELLLKHFEYLTRYANDMIIVGNEMGQVVEANERAQQALGYSREELLQKRILELHAPLDSSTFPRKLEILKQDGALIIEGIYQRKDGSTFPVEISARMIEVQGLRYLQGIVRDISERKRAMDALRESEARFRGMADSALALIWLSDSENLGTWFSKGWLEYTGRTLEQELGSGWADSVHPDDLSWCVNYCNEAFRARQNFKMEFRLRRADGSYGWIADAGIPRFTPAGEFEGYIGYCWDITEHKLFEEMRAKMEHAGRLNVAAEMASGLAHELSQPLSACNNYLDGCLRRMDEDDWDKEKLHKAIQQAYKQADRAGRIINHLKDMVRKQGHERILIDLNLLAREVMDFLENEIKRQGISIKMILFPLPQVMACRVEIEQVLLNLYKNAIEAMHSSPQRELRVITSLAAESGMVLVAVSDSGRGISPSEMAGLFNPYQTSKQQGLGLGLVMCRTSIENHGGRIWVDPQREFGAEFYFTLPVGNS